VLLAAAVRGIPEIGIGIPLAGSYETVRFPDEAGTTA
jgi:hypothetical protein